MIIAISVTLFFIVLRLSVTVFNFVSNPKLTRVNRRYNQLVSILVPARNEAGNILILLESISKQDYQHYEVIVYDDHSTDDTYAVCSGFALLHPRFKVVKGKQLPEGWLGKNFACHQLAKEAKGDFFLFIDADVKVEKSLINSAVHRMGLYNLSLLSLVPNQVMLTAGEYTTVPLMNFALLNLLPLRLVAITKEYYIASACGQFMLFDANIYKENQWHEQVKNKVVEDGEIMKITKSSGYKGDLLLGNKMLYCRMYRNYNEAINGFGKNTYAAFNYNTLAFLLYILLVIGGPALIISTLNINLIFYTCGLILLSRIMISFLSGQSVWLNIFLHPVQMFNLAIISFISIKRRITKTNEWKNRKII